jgi:hypothetical protein
MKINGKYSWKIEEWEGSISRFELQPIQAAVALIPENNFYKGEYTPPRKTQVPLLKAGTILNNLPESTTILHRILPFQSGTLQLLIGGR